MDKKRLQQLAGIPLNENWDEENYLDSGGYPEDERGYDQAFERAQSAIKRGVAQAAKEFAAVNGGDEEKVKRELANLLDFIRGEL